MRLFITGAGGQLGSEWVHTCISEGMEHRAVTSAELDITNREAVAEHLEQYRPDVLINCAAYTQVDQAESDIRSARKVNAVAVGMMAELCARYNIKLVHYSTDYVFSGSSYERAQFPDGYPEDHIKSPVNAYGLTKSEGEDLLMASGSEYMIFRVSWLCGAVGHNFMNIMLRLAQNRDELNVVNDQFGCPAFTDAVVEQSLCLIRQQKTGVFNLGSSGLISWYEFATAIFDLKGIEISVNPVSSQDFKTTAVRPHFSKLDTTKAQQAGARIPHWKDALKNLLHKI